jgi:D-glycero-alpha-D-manno-heptose-7-phosphate kinase
MIIARSPLRISLGGGGTDLPSYYREHGGFLIAAAIDKHVYVSVHHTFQRGILLRYSRTERVMDCAEIEHPIVREALKVVGVNESHLEITTMADIPAGTGLGSSGSFGASVLKALARFSRRVLSTSELAELACHIEIDRLKEPVGKQDQYAAAFGGINCYEFRPDDSVVVTPLNISETTIRHFLERTLLFCTGITREASSILKEQDDRSLSKANDMIENLHHVKALGYESKRALELGDLDAYGRLLNDHWERKKRRSARMTNAEIDKWYELGMEHGATGGKLIGAGGGGFLMFCTSDPTPVRRAFEKAGLLELRYDFDFEGAKIL